MTQSRHNRIIKSVALVLAFTFTIAELSYAAPADALSLLQPKLPAHELILRDPSLFETPAEFSTLKEVHKGAAETLIIHIQDAHANLSGQENLASTLDAIMSKYDVSLVLVEGGSKDDTLTPIKSVAPPEVWKKVAKSFLIEGKISGEEYLNLISEHPMKIMGIEDKPLYTKSVETYAELTEQREAILEYLKRVRSILGKLKGRSYPAELLAYEKTMGAKGEGKNFETQFTQLVALSKARGAELGDLTALAELGRVQAAEKAIDFGAANLEQAALIEKIQAGGGADLLAEHIKKISANKNSKLSQLAHFQNTFNIAKEKGVALDEYPVLIRYGEYLKAFSALDLEKVIDEIDTAEQRVYAAMLSDKDTRTLRAIDRYTSLLETAYRIQMTTQEFALFKANEPDFATVAYLAFLNRRLADLGTVEDLIPVSDVLEKAKHSLEAFYGSVNERDLAFMQNTERILKAENEKVAVLISGGYHTPHLTKLFKEKNYSYLVLAPVVTTETNQAKYERLLLESVKKTNGVVESVQGERKNDRSLSALEEDLLNLKKKNDNVRNEALVEAGNGARLAELVKATGADPALAAEVMLSQQLRLRASPKASEPTAQDAQLLTVSIERTGFRGADRKMEDSERGARLSKKAPSEDKWFAEQIALSRDMQPQQALDFLAMLQADPRYEKVTAEDRKALTGAVEDAQRGLAEQRAEEGRVVIEKKGGRYLDNLADRVREAIAGFEGIRTVMEIARISGIRRTELYKLFRHDPLLKQRLGVVEGVMGRPSVVGPWLEKNAKRAKKMSAADIADELGVDVSSVNQYLAKPDPKNDKRTLREKYQIADGRKVSGARLAKETTHESLRALAAGAASIKALQKDGAFEPRELDELGRWYFSSAPDLLPSALTAKKIMLQLVLNYSMGQRPLAEQWIEVLSPKWQLTPKQLTGLVKWFAVSRVDLRKVSAEALHRFLETYIDGYQRYPALRDNFIYSLPSGIDDNEKLTLATLNMQRMTGMFSSDFVAKNSILKAPIEGTPYFIGMQYGLAESTHGIYLAVGVESNDVDPMKGVFFRIGLDSQDGSLRVNMIQGVSGKQELINETFPKDTGLHPGIALLYFALQLAEDGQVRIGPSGRDTVQNPFRRMMGIRPEFIPTMKHGTPTLNVMANYGKFGLRRTNEYSRWQEVEHLKALVEKRLVVRDAQEARSIRKVVNAFNNLEEILVRLSQPDADKNDELPDPIQRREGARLAETVLDGETIKRSLDQVKELFPATGRMARYPMLREELNMIAERFADRIQQDFPKASVFGITSLYEILQNLIDQAAQNSIDSYLQRSEEAAAGTGEAFGEDLELKIELVERADAMVIRVTDNGIGVSKAENSLQKEQKKAAGVSRAGGEGTSLKWVAARLLNAIHTDARPILYERRERLGDTDGAVLELALKKEWLEKAGDSGARLAEEPVTQNGLLNEDLVNYFDAMRRIVHPAAESPFTVAYGGSGADVSSLFYATRFTTAYMIDELRVSVAELGRAIGEWKDLESRSPYFTKKFRNGWSHGYDFDKNIEFYLIQELRAMGVKEQKDITLSEDERGRPTLTFRLPGDLMTRRLIFVNRNMISPGPALSQELDGKLDAYFQKATFNLARFYSDYISAPVRWLKKEGFMMLNDYDNDGSFRDAAPHLGDAFTKRTDAALEALGAKVESSSRSGGITELPTFYGYGRLMSVWQNTGARPLDKLGARLATRRDILRLGLFGVAALMAAGIGGFSFIPKNAGQRSGSVRDELWMEYRAEPTLASVQDLARRTRDWLAANGYPDMDVIQEYVHAVETGARVEPKMAVGTGKEIDIKTGEMRVLINPIGINEHLREVIRLGDASVLVEYWVALFVREAWGFKLMKETVTEERMRLEAMNRLQSDIERALGSGEDLGKWLVGQESRVKDILANFLAFEHFEGVKQSELLYWASDRGLYSQQNAARAAARTRDADILSVNASSAGLLAQRSDRKALFTDELMTLAMMYARHQKAGLLDASSHSWHLYLTMQMTLGRLTPGLVSAIESGLARPRPHALKAQIDELFPIVKSVSESWERRFSRGARLADTNKADRAYNRYKWAAVLVPAIGIGAFSLMMYSVFYVIGGSKAANEFLLDASPILAVGGLLAWLLMRAPTQRHVFRTGGDKVLIARKAHVELRRLEAGIEILYRPDVFRVDRRVYSNPEGLVTALGDIGIRAGLVKNRPAEVDIRRGGVTFNVVFDDLNSIASIISGITEDNMAGARLAEDGESLKKTVDELLAAKLLGHSARFGIMGAGADDVADHTLSFSRDFLDDPMERVVLSVDAPDELAGLLDRLFTEFKGFQTAFIAVNGADWDAKLKEMLERELPASALRHGAEVSEIGFHQAGPRASYADRMLPANVVRMEISRPRASKPISPQPEPAPEPQPQLKPKTKNVLQTLEATGPYFDEALKRWIRPGARLAGTDGPAQELSPAVLTQLGVPAKARVLFVGPGMHYFLNASEPGIATWEKLFLDHSDAAVTVYQPGSYGSGEWKAFGQAREREGRPITIARAKYFEPETAGSPADVIVMNMVHTDIRYGEADRDRRVGILQTAMDTLKPGGLFVLGWRYDSEAYYSDLILGETTAPRELEEVLRGSEPESVKGGRHGWAVYRKVARGARLTDANSDSFDLVADYPQGQLPVRVIVVASWAANDPRFEGLDIRVESEGESVNARSVLQMTSLVVPNGRTFTVRISGGTATRREEAAGELYRAFTDSTSRTIEMSPERFQELRDSMAAPFINFQAGMHFIELGLEDARYKDLSFLAATASRTIDLKGPEAHKFDVLESPAFTLIIQGGTPELREEAGDGLALFFSPLSENATGARLAGKKGTGRQVREIQKEFKEAVELMWPYAVAVFGSARFPTPGTEEFNKLTDDQQWRSRQLYELVLETGREIARTEWGIRTGAGPAIMAWALEGYLQQIVEMLRHYKVLEKPRALPDFRTQGVKIELPFEAAVNPFVQFWKEMRHFVSRKLALYLRALGVISTPGGFGTLDEVFETWDRGIPSVLLDHPDMPFWSELMGAFKESWKEEDLTDHVETRYPPVYRTSARSAVQFIREAIERRPPLKYSKDQLGNMQQQLVRGKRLMDRWPEKSITFLGRPMTDSAVRASVELAERLQKRGYAIRVATRGPLLDKLYSAAEKGGWRDRLYAVIYQPQTQSHEQDMGEGPLGLTPNERWLGDHLISTNYHSVHQVLTINNTKANVALPGGVSTMNRLFDILTLIQTRTLKKTDRKTGRAEPVTKPVILLSGADSDFWSRIKASMKKLMLDEPPMGVATISEKDLDLMDIQKGPDAAYERLIALLEGPETRGSRLAGTDEEIAKLFERAASDRVKDMAPQYAATKAYGAPAVEFLDEVFRRVKQDPEYANHTRVVFLRAGAEPLAAVFEAMARVRGDFPVENIHSIWATMGNYRAMMKDPEQAVLFVKYLQTQGVLTEDTRRILFVDTDSRVTPEVGTELILYRTLLDQQVMAKVGLKPWNNGAGSPTAEMFYMFLDPTLEDDDLKRQGVRDARDYHARMSVGGFNGLPQDEGRRVSIWWASIDHMHKTENIRDRFEAAPDGSVRTVPAETYLQVYKGLYQIINARIALSGMIAGALEAMARQGLDITTEQRRLVADLEKVLVPAENGTGARLAGVTYPTSNAWFAKLRQRYALWRLKGLVRSMPVGKEFLLTTSEPILHEKADYERDPQLLEHDRVFHRILLGTDHEIMIAVSQEPGRFTYAFRKESSEYGSARFEPPFRFIAHTHPSGTATLEPGRVQSNILPSDLDLTPDSMAGRWLAIVSPSGLTYYFFTDSLSSVPAEAGVSEKHLRFYDVAVREGWPLERFEREVRERFADIGLEVDFLADTARITADNRGARLAAPAVPSATLVVAPKTHFERYRNLKERLYGTALPYLETETGKFPNDEQFVVFKEPETIKGQDVLVPFSLKVKKGSMDPERFVALMLTIGGLKDFGANSVSVLLRRSSLDEPAAMRVLDRLTNGHVYVTDDRYFETGADLEGLRAELTRYEEPRPTLLSALNDRMDQLVGFVNRSSEQYEAAIFTTEYSDLKQRVANKLPVRSYEIPDVSTVPFHLRGRDHVLVIHTTKTDQGILDLFILLDKLKRRGVKKISLLIPYFGYARGHENYPREDFGPTAKTANSALVILKAISGYTGDISTVNIHFFKELGPQEFPGLPGIRIHNLDAFPILASYFKENAAALGLKDPFFLAPDRGALRFVQSAAGKVGWPYGFLEKKRISATEVRRFSEHVMALDKNGAEVEVDMNGRTVVILDDIIAGGSTQMSAAAIARKLGAVRVYGAAIHGGFDKGRELKGIDLTFASDSLNTGLPLDRVIPLDEIVARFVTEQRDGARLAVSSDPTRPSNAYFELIKGDVEAEAAMKRRVQQLPPGFDALVRKKLAEMKTTGQLAIDEKDLEDFAVIVFGDFFWLHPQERPRDLDLLVLLRRTDANYNGGWDLPADPPTRLPGIALTVLGGASLDEANRKRIALLMSGQGTLLNGNAEWVQSLLVEPGVAERLDWAKGLIEAGDRENRLGLIAYPDKIWKRYFEAYVMMRPLAIRYLGEEKALRFEKQMFGGRSIQEFYRGHLAGRIPMLWYEGKADEFGPEWAWYWQSALNALQTEIRSASAGGRLAGGPRLTVEQMRGLNAHLARIREALVRKGEDPLKWRDDILASVRAGSLDVRRLIVPSEEAMRVLVEPKAIMSAARAYIRKNVMDHHKKFALQAMHDASLQDLFAAARKHNVLLVISRPFVHEDAETKAQVTAFLRALLRQLERIPPELLWEFDHPVAIEVVQFDRPLDQGYHNMNAEDAGVAVGMEPFIIGEYEKPFGAPKSAETEFHEDQLAALLAHEIVGHKRSLGRRAAYEGSPMMPRRDWLDIASANNVQELTLKQSLEEGPIMAGFSLPGTDTPIDELPADDNAFITALRGVRVDPSGYHRNLLELVAFSAEGRDLAQAPPGSFRPLNADHRLSESRDILRRDLGRIGVPVDPAENVYLTYLFDRKSSAYQASYIRKTGTDENPEWQPVRRENGRWVQGARLAGRVKDAVLTAMIVGIATGTVYGFLHWGVTKTLLFISASALVTLLPARLFKKHLMTALLFVLMTGSLYAAAQRQKLYADTPARPARAAAAQPAAPRAPPAGSPRGEAGVQPSQGEARIESARLEGEFARIKDFEDAYDRNRVAGTGLAPRTGAVSIRRGIGETESGYTADEQHGGPALTPEQIEPDTAKTVVMRAFSSETTGNLDVLLAGFEGEARSERLKFFRGLRAAIIKEQAGKAGAEERQALAGDIRALLKDRASAHKFVYLNIAQELQLKGIPVPPAGDIDAMVDAYILAWRPGQYIRGRIYAKFWAIAPLFRSSADIDKDWNAVDAELKRRAPAAAELERVYGMLQSARNRVRAKNPNWKTALKRDVEARQLLEALRPSLPADLHRMASMHVETDIEAIGRKTVPRGARLAEVQVYDFGGFDGAERSTGSLADRGILGNKGAYLADLTNIGLPVPPGYTLPGSVVTQMRTDGKISEELRAAMAEGIQRIEAKVARYQGETLKFGDARNPLFLAVRSGAGESAPGKYETVNKVGLSRDTLEAYARQIANPYQARLDYVRHIADYYSSVNRKPGEDESSSHALRQMLPTSRFGEAYMNAEHGRYAELGTLTDADSLVAQAEAEYKRLAGHDFPGAERQLEESALAVARGYENDDPANAVNIQWQVFGNIGDGQSFSGVLFSRNPFNGEKELIGNYEFGKDGRFVVRLDWEESGWGGVNTHAKRRHEKRYAELERTHPDIYRQLKRYVDIAERTYHTALDMEIVVSRGRLYFVQARGNLKSSTPVAQSRILADLVSEGILTEAEAMDKMSLDDLEWLKFYLEQKIVKPSSQSKAIGKGLPLFPGIATAKAQIFADSQFSGVRRGSIMAYGNIEQNAFQGIPVESWPIFGIIRSGDVNGILATTGGFADHAAVVIRRLNKRIPYIVWNEAELVKPSSWSWDAQAPKFVVRDPEDRLHVLATINDGDTLTLDGNTGYIYPALSDDDFEDSESVKAQKGRIDGVASPEYRTYLTVTKWIELKESGARLAWDEAYSARVFEEAKAFMRTKESRFAGENTMSLDKKSSFVIPAEWREQLRSAVTQDERGELAFWQTPDSAEMWLIPWQTFVEMTQAIPEPDRTHDHQHKVLLFTRAFELGLTRAGDVTLNADLRKAAGIASGAAQVRLTGEGPYIRMELIGGARLAQNAEAARLIALFENTVTGNETAIDELYQKAEEILETLTEADAGALRRARARMLAENAWFLAREVGTVPPQIWLDRAAQDLSDLKAPDIRKKLDDTKELIRRFRSEGARLAPDYRAVDAAEQIRYLLRKDRSDMPQPELSMDADGFIIPNEQVRPSFDDPRFVAQLSRVDLKSALDPAIEIQTVAPDSIGGMTFIRFVEELLRNALVEPLSPEARVSVSMERDGTGMRLTVKNQGVIDWNTLLTRAEEAAAAGYLYEHRSTREWMISTDKQNESLYRPVGVSELDAIYEDAGRRTLLFVTGLSRGKEPDLELGGRGQGLVVARKYALASGGTFQIDSNGGTTVTAWFPASGARLAVTVPQERLHFLEKVRRVANRDNRPQLAFYAHAGADVAEAMLAVNPTTLIMSDRLPFGDKIADRTDADRREIEKVLIKSGASMSEQTLNNFITVKKGNLRELFVAYLGALGVEAGSVSIDRLKDGGADDWRILFAWRHPSETVPKTRVVYYLGSRQTKDIAVDTLPESVMARIRINAGADIFIEKAPNYYQAVEKERQTHIDAKEELHEVNRLKLELVKAGGLLLGDVELGRTKGEESSNTILMASRDGFEPIKLPMLWHFRTPRWGNGEIEFVRRVSGGPALGARLATPLPSLEAIKDYPAHELVSALGLEKATVLERSGLEGAGDASVWSIEIPERADRRKTPIGTDILDSELGRTRRFELLYDGKDRLIAVFPVFVGSQPVSGSYLDLSNYYVPYGLLRRVGDVSAHREWEAFARSKEETKALIRRYKDSRGRAGFLLTPLWDSSLQSPFVYAELNDEGVADTFPFYPEYFLTPYMDSARQFDRIFSERKGVSRAVFVLPPTVYSPGRAANRRADDDFTAHIYADAAAGYPENARVLDPTAGSGYNTWVVWAAQKDRKDIRYFASDKNPLAAAAAKINLQLIAGIPVEVKQHDNIISPEGTEAFPGEFDRIVSNTPAYRDADMVGPDDEAQSLDEIHDGGRNGHEFLPRFLDSLSTKLKTDTGRALIWTDIPALKVDPAPELILARGLAYERLEGLFNGHEDHPTYVIRNPGGARLSSDDERKAEHLRAFATDGTIYHRTWVGGVWEIVHHSKGVMVPSWFANYPPEVSMAHGVSFINDDARKTPQIVLQFDVEALAPLHLNVTDDNGIIMGRVPLSALTPASKKEVLKALMALPSQNGGYSNDLELIAKALGYIDWNDLNVKLMGLSAGARLSSVGERERLKYWGDKVGGDGITLFEAAKSLAPELHISALEAQRRLVESMKSSVLASLQSKTLTDLPSTGKGARLSEELPVEKFLIDKLPALDVSVDDVKKLSDDDRRVLIQVIIDRLTEDENFAVEMQNKAFLFKRVGGAIAFLDREGRELTDAQGVPVRFTPTEKEISDIKEAARYALRPETRPAVHETADEGTLAFREEDRQVRALLASLIKLLSSNADLKVRGLIEIDLDKLKGPNFERNIQVLKETLRLFRLLDTSNRFANVHFTFTGGTDDAVSGLAALAYQGDQGSLPRVRISGADMFPDGVGLVPVADAEKDHHYPIRPAIYLAVYDLALRNLADMRVLDKFDVDERVLAEMNRLAGNPMADIKLGREHILNLALGRFGQDDNNETRKVAKWYQLRPLVKLIDAAFVSYLRNLTAVGAAA